MNKAELLDENATLRRALYRPERSRLTQRRADLLKENKAMRAELAARSVEIEPQPPPRPIKRRLRASRVLRKLNWG